MKLRIKNPIPYLFYALFFIAPLIFTSKTSELFEFNKMVVTYAFTVAIAFFWIAKMILERKVIFRRTILDFPILAFLGAQILSTLISFDLRTSLFGYYSRFHGGLFSSISYALLYWAYVANMDRKKTRFAILSLFSSATIASFWGILEHFGKSPSCLFLTSQFNTDCWVQDVQNRVFATLGQPNWLAALLVALIPSAWVLGFRKKLNGIFVSLSSIFFLTLLYTKSRSGILSFAIAYLVFWAGVTFIKKGNIKKLAKPFTLITSLLIVITLVVGTPWSPSLRQMFKKDVEKIPQKPPGPALEVGGTESGKIRKIVWQGAIDIWKNYPLLGTGVETFAYSYYNFRPAEHNLVSEWDFLYNKAHNEYLNIAATTGTLGLITYFYLVGMAGYLFIKKGLSEKSNLSIGLFAGYLSILVTNFFGFSVVIVGLFFFLFPAMAIALDKKEGKDFIKIKRLDSEQKIGVSFVLIFFVYLLFLTGRYWYTDHLYNLGKTSNDSDNPASARKTLQKTIKISPNEAIYWSEVSEASTNISISLYESGEEKKAEEFAKAAVEESDKATSLSPKNVNLKRTRASMFIKLSAIDQNHLLKARETLMDAIALAPTDAKLYYNLGLTNARVGDAEEAIKILKYTVEIKENYRNARLALALLLIDQNKIQEAKKHLTYILENINPKDKLVKEQLEAL